MSNREIVKSGSTKDNMIHTCRKNITLYFILIWTNLYENQMPLYNWKRGLFYLCHLIVAQVWFKVDLNPRKACVKTKNVHLPLSIVILQDLLLHIAYMWKMLVYFHVLSNVGVERIQYVILSSMVSFIIFSLSRCLLMWLISSSLPRVGECNILSSGLCLCSKVKILCGNSDAT